jgi:hypothetical protein
MKTGCWAADLGDCSGKLSGEHIISSSLWSGPTVTVSGGPWGEPREIGVANVTAKILCQAHNSRLSELDVAGSNAFAAFTREVILTNGRQLISARPWTTHCFSIDGARFERWFVKTTINIATLLRGGVPEWAFDGTVGRPPLPLVEAVFGVRKIERPIGLYTAAAVGDDIRSTEEVRSALLFDEDSRIGGASYVFRGYSFVVNLRNREIAGVRAGDDGRTLRTKDNLIYHLNRMNIDVGGHRSAYIDFNWPDADFYHFTP